MIYESIIVAGLTIMCSFLFYNIISISDRKNKKIQKLQDELFEKDCKIANMRSEITMLQLKVQMNVIHREKSIKIPKGTIEAVRYAMVHNHPDNGGEAEKFILYKSCYDKLIGKE